MRDYRYEYNHWIQNKNLNKELMAELELIKDQTQEIEERFYKDLEFGTGGLRGIIGAGTNRMNIYTIRKLTLALANYISAQGTKAMKQGVVIAYDSRKYSREFAEEAAKVLAANNIKVYLFDELRPTPLLSFAVRYLNTFSGIVITASHNPSNYNGYKVYNENGSQITENVAEQIYNEINKIEDILEISVMDLGQAIKDKKVIIIGEEIDSEYIKKVKTLLINIDYISKFGEKLKVVYTPLHGTGNKIVRRLLNEIDLKNLYIVREQEEPNPDFPTVKAPNPEEAEVFDLAIKLAEQVDADIIMATDPDADRLGLLVKIDNKYQAFNGNQLGVLILYYLISEKFKNGTLSKDSVIVKTIVTSDLGRKIADKYHLSTEDTLTGFKYIGEMINKFESDEDGNKKFFFGYEESYGYLIGDFVRDKDAVQITAIIVEMAIFYKQKGYTLFDILHKIFNEHGFYAEELISLKFEGINKNTRIPEIMTKVRKNSPNVIDNVRVKIIEDYLYKERIDKIDNKITSINLPKSNVIKLILEDDSWVALRPSGTEPKIKIYFSAKANSYFEVNTKLKGMKKTISSLLNLNFEDNS